MARRLGEQFKHSELQKPAPQTAHAVSAETVAAGTPVKHNDSLSDISRYCQSFDSAQDDKGPDKSAGAAKYGPVRLDKFMKVSRLAKRRSEAHEALEHGRVTREGRLLKPAYQVKPGDVLEIHYATKFVTVRVREVPLRVTPATKPAELYEILGSRQDESEWL
ncbi:MAG: RNA-binding S4 domain-containing protein [Candidatus Cybelea sp.]